MKLKFGQRIGVTPVEKAIQLNDIDTQLRTAIWNVFTTSVLPYMTQNLSSKTFEIHNRRISVAFWIDCWGFAADEAPRFISDLSRFIKKAVQGGRWVVVYELVEFACDLIENIYKKKTAREFREAFNFCFESHNSGYRFVHDQIAPITNPVEIQAVNDTFELTSKFTALGPCNVHLTKSLSLLSDLQSPDYTNSVKESISALESLAKILSKDSKGTLGDAIKRLPKEVALHPSLVQGIGKIYGYTSDEGGIRHALTEGDKTDFDDAKFMLITCSSLINYLVVKAQKGGVSLNR